MLHKKPPYRNEICDTIAVMVTPTRRRRFIAVAKARQQGLALVLEDVHDPMNAAAIMRTADAFGVQEVHLIFAEEKPWNPRRVGKASSSAHKWLTFKIYRSTAMCLSSLSRRGYKIVATALTSGATNLYRAKLTAPKLALVVGNEHRGLSAAALARADHTVAVPMRGMVQSLNVSVTAALCIAEIVRQRDTAPSKTRRRYRTTARERGSLVRELSKR